MATHLLNTDLKYPFAIYGHLYCLICITVCYQATQMSKYAPIYLILWLLLHKVWEASRNLIVIRDYIVPVCGFITSYFTLIHLHCVLLNNKSLWTKAIGKWQMKIVCLTVHYGLINNMQWWGGSMQDQSFLYTGLILRWKKICFKHLANRVLMQFCCHEDKKPMLILESREGEEFNNQLDIQCLFHRKNDVFDLRYTVVLQNLCVRHGDVHTSHAHSGCIQIIESRPCK